MVLFLVTFLSCLLKFSIAFVVYISFLIPSGYLEYVDNSAQLFFQELTHIGYFYPIFLQGCLNLLRLSLLLVLCTLLLGPSLILLYLCRIHILLSFLFGELCMIFPAFFGCISALGYTASIASLNPGRLSVENINTSSSLLSFSSFNTKANISLIPFPLPRVCPSGTFLVFL